MSDEPNILLICTAGITTGLLVKNMESAAEEKGLNLNILSASANKAKDLIEERNMEAILIGPQAEQEVQKLERYFNKNHIPFRTITRKTYERLDGNSALEEALRLLND